MIKKGKETFSGYNKPKRTPNHPTKSHAVLAKDGDQEKLIRFGQKGVSGDKTSTDRAKSFKARHAKNIANKRARIKAGSGEKMRKVGSKGAPTAMAFKQSAKTAKKKK